MKRWLSKIFLAMIIIASVVQAKSKETIEQIQQLNPGEVIVAEGKVAYSKPWSFDYDKDGTDNHIVMGAHLFIKKTKDGKYKGFLERGLFDIDLNVSIGWYLNRGMLQQPPMVRDISVKNVVHKGTTVKFDIENVSFTVIDGGKGHNRDKVVVDDHVKSPRTIELYDGDMEVIP